jgi:hypothetical protein
LDDLCHRAGDSLAIEGCFSGRRIVHDETCYSLSTDGERVQPEDVHIAIGECPANFAERAGRIIHENGEFFADWHGDLLSSPGMQNAFSVGLGRQRKSYASPMWRSRSLTSNMIEIFFKA